MLDRPDRKVWPVVVALVKMLDEALRLVAVKVPMTELEALTVVPLNKVTPRTLELRLIWLPEAVVLVPLARVISGVEVVIIWPVGDKAKKLPPDKPVKAKLPVVVALVKIDEEAFNAPKLEVLAFIVNPLNKVSPSMEEFKLTVEAPVMLMLLPATTEER